MAPMHQDCSEISLPAMFGSLPALLDWAQATALGLGMTGAQTGRLQLVLEELLCNTIKHGYRGESAARVAVAMHRDGGRLRVIYTDAAPPFDPTATIVPPGAASRALGGGAGLDLIRGLTQGLGYEYVAGRNRVSLRFDAGTPGVQQKSRAP
jgi:anti-sigma regulatory factor (Ser/Thr protein kinase)